MAKSDNFFDVLRSHGLRKKVAKPLAALEGNRRRSGAGGERLARQTVDDLTSAADEIRTCVLKQDRTRSQGARQGCADSKAQRSQARPLERGEARPRGPKWHKRGRGPRSKASLAAQLRGAARARGLQRHGRGPRSRASPVADQQPTPVVTIDHGCDLVLLACARRSIVR